MYDKGRELLMASISMTEGNYSSKVKQAQPITFLRHRLVDLTN